MPGPEVRAERFRKKYRTDQETEAPKTLEELLEGKVLKSGEERTALAIDALGVPLEEGKVLLGADTFINDPEGILRVNYLLDTIPDQAVSMRNKVRTNKRYQEKWDNLELLKEPYFAEVAIRKRQGKKHKEIAEELELTKQQVDGISKSLIAARIIEISPLGRSSSLRFAEIVEAVRAEDSLNNPRLEEKALAGKFSVSVNVIRRARRRIKARSNPYKPKLSKRPSPDSIHMRRELVKGALKQGATVGKISQIFDIPIVLVRNDRRWLIKKGEIAKSVNTRAAKKDKFRQFVQRHRDVNPPGVPINLKEFQRNWGEPISHYTLWSLNNEFKEEEALSKGLVENREIRYGSEPIEIIGRNDSSSKIKKPKITHIFTNEENVEGEYEAESNP